jgi:chaperone BCS1
MYNYHPGLRKVKHTLDHFLSHKAFYAKNRLDYKRSFMLFGDPGTGKSRFVDETTRSLVETHNAVVIRVESDSQLAILADVGVPELHSFLPGRMKIFVLEELAELLERSRNEARLLNFLDSTFFRHDVLYFITTNYPEKIPQNIVDRPSRVDDLIAINSTDFEAGFIPAWYEHLLGRSFPKSEIKSAWLKETCGRISPAYLKELFLYAELHQCSLDYSWKQIKDRRRMIDNNFCPTRERKMGFHLEPDLPKHHSRADVTEGIIEEEDDFLEELRKMLDSED